MALTDYSTNPNLNTNPPPAGAPEGMPPSGVNNVLRQIQADLATIPASGGSALVGDIEPGTGAQSRTVFSILRERVRVFSYMTTAQRDDVLAGTKSVDVRSAVQAAFDYALSLPRGCVIEMPGGGYYLGTGIDASDWAQLNLGHYLTTNAPNNVDLEAYGAILYPGRAGRAMGIFNATRAKIMGLKIIGYCGGTLGSTRQNDACLTINYNSYNVTLEDLYLTNSLGDQIYAGGSLVSGGETGYETRNLVLKGCTLKTRYGDGIPSSSGGSMSRTAMAIIDAIGVTIDDTNTIYGGIDCEPNVNNQHLVGINLSPKFLNGNVTAQAVIGTDYWYDEPINSSGGTVIDGFIATGSVATPIVSDFHVKGATFQQGQIVQTNGNSNYTSITGNKFDNGIIRLSGAVNYTEVKDNFAKGNNSFAESYYSLVTPRFISINGATSYARITGNTAVISGGYCISKEGSGADTAGNDWSNNRNMHASRTGHMDFSPITGSVGATEEVVSFTPVLSGVTTAGTQTYSQQIGRYTRIGKLIHVYIRILLSAKGGTMAGDVVITGLPHAIANVSNLYTMIPISHANVTLGAGNVLFGQLEPGGSRVYLQQVGSAAGYASLDSAGIANNSEFEISFCYVCN